MATDLGYTVLPVSAIKRHHTAIFDTLEAEKTVYIAKRGKIVAAFRPYTAVPESVAALHNSPILKDLPSITARQIGRDSLSEVITEAESGLPTVVENKGRIYGILTAAAAPAPETIPDPDIVGAKAEALLEFQRSNPGASIDEIMAFSDSLDQGTEEVAPPHEVWPPAPVEDSAAVAADIDRWRARDSLVEDIVAEVFTLFDTALPLIDDDAQPFGRSALWDDLMAEMYDLTGTDGPGTRSGVLRGEKLEAAGELVDARTVYVHSLIRPVTGLPDTGVMWRLGNLNRRAGHRAEAARWFRLALLVDSISTTAEHTAATEIPQTAEIGAEVPAAQTAHRAAQRHSDKALSDDYVVLFDTVEASRRAEKALEAAGFADPDVNTLDAAAVAKNAAKANVVLGLWKRLFGQEIKLYEGAAFAALAKGGAILSVHIKGDGDAAKAEEILARHNPVDLQARGAGIVAEHTALGDVKESVQRLAEEQLVEVGKRTVAAGKARVRR